MIPLYLRILPSHFQYRVQYNVYLKVTYLRHVYKADYKSRTRKNVCHLKSLPLLLNFTDPA